MNSIIKTEHEYISELHTELWNLPWELIDELFVENESVRRPLKGYCFETLFIKLMNLNGYDVLHGSGDDIVDLVVNGHTLQLKTPYWRETIENKSIAYRFHKTHGPERFPDALYTSDEFADFLVGLCPDNQMIICPKEALTKHRKYSERFHDPQRFSLRSEWINRFDLLGIELQTSLESITHENVYLPRTGEMVELSDIEIIKTILKPVNFRLLRQNIKGALRETICKIELQRRGVELRPPNVSTFSINPQVKIDGYLPDGRSVQIKGVTQRLSSNGITLGVEIKGSHGRIPNRLYTPDAFDILIIVIDPGTISIESNNINPNVFNYHLVKNSDLPLHERSGEWNELRLKDIYKFDCTVVELNNFGLIS